jgi:predicted DNA-binding transcriptional regulator AlpA
MNLQIEDQFLRMSDLANQAAKPETTKIDKTGCKLTHKAIPAKRGITGFSAKHIYHLINDGKFPAPIKLGRASLWRLSDINNWLKQQGFNDEN